jgi:hypothetical protein
MNSPSPIVLFTYKRFERLQKTIQCLSDNFLASDSDLIIYSDGAKSIEEMVLIVKIRAYLKTISGFKSVTIHESPSNKGLAASIIQGVSEVLKVYPTAIVLEDDLITSLNFLVFMNQALDYYQDFPQVLSISGYSPIIKGLNEDEVYYTKRSSSWGWACWREKWNKIDWECSYYDIFKNNPILKSKFNEMGSDLSHMMKKQMEGNLNSWAIRFSFHQFQNQMYSVHPAISKINNIGLTDINATNTNQKYNRFRSTFDKSNNKVFFFTNKISLDLSIIKQFRKSNSFTFRIVNKIMNFLH